jgi:hypothetical protein
MSGDIFTGRASPEMLTSPTLRLSGAGTHTPSALHVSVPEQLGLQRGFSDLVSQQSPLRATSVKIRDLEGLSQTWPRTVVTSGSSTAEKSPVRVPGAQRP